MIIDTSAIVAIFFQEPGYEELIQRLILAEKVAIGAPTLVECGIVLSARLGRDATSMLTRFLEERQIAVTPFTEAHFGIAVSAWHKYGKGRHPAGLNFGDCLTYAMVYLTNQPLLYVGSDFPQTDLNLSE